MPFDEPSYPFRLREGNSVVERSVCDRGANRAEKIGGCF
ncbi:hypothetical protein X961_5416 [Burkholderia pseudomallei MSHR5613]|nr:hypothetical protein X961_5416 [Burkholderia pseudomallei MSHR5613]